MRFLVLAACGVLALAGCGGPADDDSDTAAAPAVETPAEEPLEADATSAPVDDGPREIDCRISSAYGARYEGSCRFTPDRGGSFSLARPGGGPLLEGVTDVSLQVTGDGTGEVRGLTTDGVNSRWGAVTRSTKDPACWTGSDFEICAW